MKVIKLGGSLMHDAKALKSCLDTIEQKVLKPVTIVPGGGVFADQVRLVQQQWQFNNKIAHEMALLAMQQMALLYKSIKPNFSLVNQASSIDNSSPVTIWSPDITELNLAAVDASWEVTSDSLAAWLALILKADELIIVKSAQIPETLNIKQLQQQGMLDQAFSRYVKNSPYTITLINKNSFNEHAFI